MSGESNIGNTRNSGEEAPAPLDFFSFTQMGNLSMESVRQLYWFSSEQTWLTPELQAFHLRMLQYYDMKTAEEGRTNWLEIIPTVGRNVDEDLAICGDAVDNVEGAPESSHVIGDQMASLSIVANGSQNTFDDYDSPESPPPPARKRARSPSPDYDPISPSYPTTSPAYDDRSNCSSSPTERSLTPVDRPRTPTTSLIMNWANDSSLSPACSLLIDENKDAPESPPVDTASAIEASATTSAVSDEDDDCMVIDEDPPMEPDTKRPRTDSGDVPSPPSRSSSEHSSPSAALPVDETSEDRIAREAKELQKQQILLMVQNERQKIQLENEMYEQRWSLTKKGTGRRKSKTNVQKAINDEELQPSTQLTRPQRPDSPAQSVSTMDSPASPPAQPHSAYSQESLHRPSSPQISPLPRSATPPSFMDGFPQIAHPNKVSCAFCGKLHPSECCHVYDTFDKRNSKLRELGLCFHCLYPLDPVMCFASIHQKWCTICHRHKSHPAMCNSHRRFGHGGRSDRR